jgi:threonine dehydratase
LALPDKTAIERAGEIVYSAMQPTPQYTWPLINRRVGAEVWLKHENHTPVGAFKVRGGLAYFRHLRESNGGIKRVVTATRGNHGQSIGFAAGREGFEALVYVPHGNSESKNAAMRSLGAKVIEFGSDFQAAREEAGRVAVKQGLHFVPSFHQRLIAGVATYSYELLQAVDGIDVAYVPIGLGSGICGMIAAREALGLKTEIVGVVSAQAPAYYDSFRQRRAVERDVTTELADGLACRVPDSAALDVIWRHVSRVVAVDDAEVAAAMAILFEDTHNVAEGAGAAGLAAILQEKERIRGKRVATVLSGANVDAGIFAEIIGKCRCRKAISNSA